MTMITPSYLGETIEYSSLHACRSTLEDPIGSAGEAQQNIGGTVVADEQHQFHQVADGYSQTRLLEQAGERTAARMQVGGMDLNHLVELQLAEIDTMKQLDRDGDLERAGHGKPFVPMERNFSPGFEMNGCRAHRAASDLRDAFHFALQANELRISGGQGSGEKECRKACGGE